MIARLRDVSAGRQALLVRSNGELRALSMRIFDRTFVITDVLYWLALAVASIGMLGAMAALQLERSREFAVLRSLGMTPRQLAGMVTMQTAGMGFLCGLAAIPLGLLMAWMLIDVINRRAFGWHMDIAVSAAVLLAGLGLATGTAFAAGLYPARRAARADPALAMREE
jgi:putative ABC transport system permease protein